MQAGLHLGTCFTLSLWSQEVPTRIPWFGRATGFHEHPWVALVVAPHRLQVPHGASPALRQSFPCISAHPWLL